MSRVYKKIKAGDKTQERLRTLERIEFDFEKSGVQGLMSGVSIALGAY